MYPELKPNKFLTPARTPSQSKMPTSGESVHVFCRVRPIKEESCIKVTSDTTVQLTLPESAVNFRPGMCKEYQYSFRKVFSEANSQKEIFNTVALPLVENLIMGKNGLLFTYGVTGSGKTYTMTGVPEDVGIMPRCFDVLFNSISDYQAKRFVFKPDRMNGFDVQSEKDAEKEAEQWLRNTARYGELKKKESHENLTCARSKDGSKVDVPDEDNAFAVFVTYIEVYNKNVYDLLENVNESDICAKRQYKFVREDTVHNSMYVLGVTEVEVKSAEEACEVFYRGQKRKRMAHTVLNTESSRSHSIFTIRLVQAPLDVNGEYVFKDKKEISISQLSLVDLAGSERTNRTNNIGQRLREAGSINNSLMTLRTCLEILRENQQTGSKQPIPFRESKLTHLFKNFFDGQGDIRMIVCVNPRIDDYDETVQVMRFAEVSQEIIVKPTPMKTELPVGLTPGRRRAHQMQRRNLQNLEEVRENVTVPQAYITNDVEMIYSLDPFPNLENFDPLDEDSNKNLMKFLKERIQKKEELMADISNRAQKFRAMLLDRDENYRRLQQDYEAINATREHEQKKIKNLEDRLVSLNASLSSWKRKYEQATEEYKKLKRDLDHKDTILHQFSAEKDREKRVNQKIAAKTEKLAKEKENTLKEKKQIEIQLKDKEKKLRMVKKALGSQNDLGGRVNVASRSDDCDTETETIPSSIGTEIQYPETPISSQQTLSPTKSTNSVVSNPRYGRTHCDNHDQWLDHRAAISAPLNTVLQPVLKRRRSFTSVTSPKDVAKMSKYCLITQNQDEEGAVETQIYKGDVAPTCAGGAQIIFNDVETLKQTSPVTSPATTPRRIMSPVTSPRRVQHYEMNAAVAASSGSSLYPDISSRCAVSVEGHSQKRK